jgi:hypothetical protein
MMMRCLFTLLFVALSFNSNNSFAAGFSLKEPAGQRFSHRMNVEGDVQVQHQHHAKSWPENTSVTSATAAALLASNLLLFPLVSLAAETAEEYEYGAVDAPIGLAIGAGILAILTAAVPVLLRPGEKALDEMREREGNAFGTGKSQDTLNKRRK